MNHNGTAKRARVLSILIEGAGEEHAFKRHTDMVRTKDAESPKSDHESERQSSRFHERSISYTLYLMQKST